LRPGIAFGADLIAGFPTETDEMFRRSLDLIGECDLSWLHVFPYSSREGTPAARMPQIPSAVRKERAAQLRAAGELAAQRFLDRQTGTEAVVLVERDDSGYSEHFAPVRLTGPAPEGTLVRARIERRDGLKLVGEAVRRAA
ncbi:MAG: tRNA (N(6)-L-threonylcarbamoyladenosine(37)-C(2))-methylthiotransferase MtaB, partial [Alphaproteobacteria bacterium]|nr:tRNA (N(6)-L-threonylcarbamoyladenosine(37)-C(2))-methylthiotransferase MtaB [Alphaproteobacteria bacterium]